MSSYDLRPNFYHLCKCVLNFFINSLSFCRVDFKRLNNTPHAVYPVSYTNSFISYRSRCHA